MERVMIVIDGNSLINRAYYAMQRPMITKEGLYTQGVFGFLNMLAKLRRDYEPGYLAVAFDRKAPTFRHLEYDAYKAGRRKMPPELAMQLPLLKEVLEAMHIKMLEMDGWEADDIIGTVAGRAEQAGLEPLIITGDKDELQLATDITKVLITRKGISEFDLFDRQAMIDKYGFTPQQFIDYKGLMGDPSDHIPGIPGVGEKTAAKLLLEFGSIENLLENAAQIKNEKLRAKVTENAASAIMSKRLATIVTSVPIDLSLEDCRVVEPDYDGLINVYLKLEFNSFLKKLERPEKGRETAEAAKREKTTWEGVVLTAIEPLAAAVRKTGSVALKLFSDESHKEMPQLQCILAGVDGQCFYIDGQDEALCAAFISMMNESKPEILGHDLIRAYYVLLSKGLRQELRTGFDTGIAAYVLDPSRSNYELKTLLYEYFHEELPDEGECGGQMDLFSDPAASYLAYGIAWCGAVTDLKHVLTARLAAEQLETVYYDIELPLIEVMASMECWGFTVDRSVLSETGKSLHSRIEEISAEICNLAGETFNINSTQQLGVILFEKLGLQAGKKTKKGYSTNAETLERLMGEHPIIPLILEYRMLTKLAGTYVDGLLPLIHTDGRIHAHFRQTVTATGRISCTEPNLQNIPIKSETGRLLRRAFVPEQGWILCGADYSQIELRVLADMSGDPELIRAFNEGLDIHRITASRVFNIPFDSVTPTQRSNAKAVNFGVIYGMSGFGLSSELHISRKEAEQYIADYFAKYAKVRSFMDEQVALARAEGFVRTRMGRKRPIPEITASNYMVRQMGERLAMNSPIQGTAADIIKIAMIRVYRALKREGLRARLLLQVHDELILETPPEEAEQAGRLLKAEMEQAVTMQVRMTAELNTGENWYELK